MGTAAQSTDGALVNAPAASLLPTQWAQLLFLLTNACCCFCFRRALLMVLPMALSLLKRREQNTYSFELTK
jgi:hypothetical protein